ncbi:MAG: RICIN domain-containing protein [Cytophagales bacterium]|nr:RICIN domain-containing protein [Cytophagales bacterium]
MKHLLTILFSLSLIFATQAQFRVNTWYKLTNKNNNLSIANNGQKNKGAIMNAKRKVGQGGLWKFINMGGGFVRIQNKNSKMYLANFGNRSNGAKIKQTNTPGSGALWKIRDVTNGGVRCITIQNKISKMYLATASSSDRTSVIQSSYNSRCLWRLVGNNSTTNNTNTTTTYNNSSNNNSSSSSANIQPNTWYRMKSSISKKYIAANGRRNHGDVMSITKQNREDAHWKFINMGSGYYRIQNKKTKYYLSAHGQRNNNALMKMVGNPGIDALWYAQKSKDGRGYTFRNKQTGMLFGTLGTYEGATIVQKRAYDKTTWILEVEGASGSSSNTGVRYPHSDNVNAFSPKRGGQIARAMVRYTDQIFIRSVKDRNGRTNVVRPRVGQKIYFFPQQVSSSQGINFDPKKPPVCGQVYRIVATSPQLKLDRPMPHMRNRNNSHFSYVVEIY